MKWSIYSICILCILALSGVALCADQMGNKTPSQISLYLFRKDLAAVL